MDISGPLRTLLRSHVPAEPPAQTPLELLAQRVAFPEQATADAPPFLREGATPVSAAPFAQPLHAHLTLASALRVIPRLGRWIRAEAGAILRPQFAAVQTSAEKLLLARATPPVDFLWHHYLLALAQVRLDLAVADTLLTGLWRRAWGAWARQSQPALLHPSAQGASPDVALHQDLAAIHAAYNAILLLQQLDRLDPLEKLIRWHAQNAPPDNTATEPWGLAAIACLDETQTFAQQQLHHATHGQPMPLTLPLLADALLTQEETAG